MTTVYHSAQRAAVATMTTVSTSADVIIRASGALGDLAESAAIKSRAFRNSVEASTAYAAEDELLAMEEDYAMRSAKRTREHLATLVADPALASLYSEAESRFAAVTARLKAN